MKRIIFTTLIFVFSVFILNGCYSDNHVDSGVFAGPSVEGLQYSTKGFSGKTDASGRFRYVEGEVVTFSVGDIVLGHAEGNDVITPYDLCGLDVIEDETELQALLKKSPSSSHTRLINIIVLLKSLDQGDGSGIVISDEVRRLLTIDSFDLTLNSDEFNLQLRQFYLKADDAGIKTGLVTPTVAVSYLSNRLSTSYKQIQRVSIDHDNDNIEDNYISFEYSASGKLISKVQDLVGLRSTETWGYDDRALLVSYDLEMTIDTPGGEQTRTEEINFTYDDAGRLTTREADEESGGLSRNRIITIQYDDEDRVILNEAQESTSDGATMNSSQSYTFNEYGNRESSEMHATYSRGDDVQLITQVITYSYNDKKQPTAETITGAMTNNGESQTLSSSSTVTYNSDGQRERRDNTASLGGRNSTSVEIYTYNEFGQALRISMTSNDTFMEQNSTAQNAYEITYSQYGLVDKFEETQARYINDVFVNREVMSFDKNQNIAKYERLYNISKNAGVKSGESKAVPQNIGITFSYTCDDNNNIIVARADKDSDGEPEITQSFEYDETGYMLKRRLLGETSDSIYTYTYNEDKIAVEDADPSVFEDIYRIQFDNDFYFSYDKETTDLGDIL